MVQKQYQYSWHGIFFSDFDETSDDTIADNQFYDLFYKSFFDRYKSFADLDLKYKTARNDIHGFLVSKLSGFSDVLSIGCGIGWFEYRLALDEEVSAHITALEPSHLATRWLEESSVQVFHGYFPSALQSCTTRFPFAYSRALEYIFTQSEYISFLRMICQYPIRDFTIISVSIQRTSLIANLKYLIKNILHYMRIRNRGKFWGYVRTRKDHFDAFSAAGFVQIEIENINDFTIAITGRSLS